MLQLLHVLQRHILLLLLPLVSTRESTFSRGWLRLGDSGLTNPCKTEAVSDVVARPQLLPAA